MGHSRRTVITKTHAWWSALDGGADYDGRPGSSGRPPERHRRRSGGGGVLPACRSSVPGTRGDGVDGPLVPF